MSDNPTNVVLYILYKLFKLLRISMKNQLRAVVKVKINYPRVKLWYSSGVIGKNKSELWTPSVKGWFNQIRLMLGTCLWHKRSKLWPLFKYVKKNLMMAAMVHFHFLVNNYCNDILDYD